MDSAERVNPLLCEICQKEFTSVSNKNRHLRKIHNDDSAKVDRMQHIVCCLCPHDNREKFSSYNSLNKHITNIHSINIKENVFQFRSSEEFEAWRGEENREVDYVSVRTLKTTNGETVVYYYCNRSDYRGYESVCEQRNLKLGGSIHIRGICPSRITVRISTDGVYNVTFIETHVGHDDDLRSKRLSKSQKQVLVGKLAAGISTDRIIQDAREVQDDKLERLNIITREDLAYLVRKYNIDKKRHADDMVATTMKVAEWK